MKNNLLSFIFFLRDYFSPNFDYILINLNNLHKNKLIIFDVGAFHGNFVNRCLKILKKTTNYHIFEPSSKENKILKNKFYKLKNSKINNCALGEKSGTKIFYESHIPTISSFKKINSKSYLKSRILFFKLLKTIPKGINLNNVYTKTKVNVLTLDQYCKNLSIDKIDYLKIDVEGFEKEVLIGAKNLLKNKSIQYIQLELICYTDIKKEYILNEYQKLLHGYKLISIKKHSNIFYFKSKIEVYDAIYEVIF